MSWREQALCVGRPTEFCPSEDVQLHMDDVRAAIEDCRRCPVIWQCRNELNTIDHPSGVWAGQFYDPRSRFPHTQAYELWHAGNCDRVISEKLGVNRRDVTKWRQRNNLTTNKDPNRTDTSFRPDHTKHALRMKLWKEGATDAEIAAASDTTISGAASWRKRHHLPINPSANTKRPQPPPIDAEEEERRANLYRQGMSDRAIARTVGVHPRTIYGWRQSRGLPPGGAA